MDDLIELPARQGRAVRVPAGRRIEIVNTFGTQVVDTWIVNAEEPSEFLSLEHFRAVTSRLMPRIGDGMTSNRRRPLATLVEDTSPGVHDTLIAACDPHRYRLLGHQGHHDNCTRNFHAALEAAGVTGVPLPSPLNLWMNIPVEGNDLGWCPPVSAAGDRVVFRAEVDCLFVLSACPQDMVPINGADMVPKAVHYRVLA